MVQDWHQKERGNSLLLRFLIWLVRIGGRTPGRLLLYPIVLYFILTAPGPRRASARFLYCATGEKAGFSGVFRHVYTFATTLLDRVLLFSGRYSHLDVRLHHREVVHEAARHGGCLLITSHLGSFEVMRATGRNRFELPVRMVMDRRPGAMLEAVLGQFDPEAAAAIIDGSRGQLDTILRIREALAGRDWVGIMGDRAVPGQRSVACDFLGGTAAFPLTPWLIAATLGVPVIVCVALYRGGKRYDVHFEQMTGPVTLPRGRREQQAAEWARRYAAWLAAHARSAPYNWFNFYDFWADDETTSGPHRGQST